MAKVVVSAGSLRPSRYRGASNPLSLNKSKNALAPKLATVTPRRIAQRLGDVLGALIRDLILCHHRDRLRRCQNRSVGLGRGCALTGEIADNGADTSFANSSAAARVNGLLLLLLRRRRGPPRAALRPRGPSRRLRRTGGLRLRCIHRDGRQRLTGLGESRSDLHAQPEHGYAEKALRCRTPCGRPHAITLHRSRTPKSNYPHG